MQKLFRAGKIHAGGPPGDPGYVPMAYGVTMGRMSAPPVSTRSHLTPYPGGIRPLPLEGDNR